MAIENLSLHGPENLLPIGLVNHVLPKGSSLVLHGVDEGGHHGVVPMAAKSPSSFHFGQPKSQVIILTPVNAFQSWYFF